MRILQVTTVAVTISAFILPIIARLKEQSDATVDVLTNDDKGQLTGLAEIGNVHPIGWGRNLLGSVHFYDFVNEVQTVVLTGAYDIVHVHTPIASFIVRFAISKLPDEKKPIVIYTAHGYHFHPGGNKILNVVYYALEKKAAAWTDYIININSHDHAATRQFGSIPENRCIFMQGIGVDIEFYQNAPNTSREHYLTGISSAHLANAILLCCVAEFNNNKSQLDQIRALARTNNENIHLLLAGTGKKEPLLKHVVAQLGLQSRVHFLGQLNDVRPLLHISTALILSSKREGLPRSILEAMACGLPVIGSDIRGIRDLVTNDTGILYKAGDVDALAQAMLRIANDREFVQSAGQSAQNAVKSFSITAVVEAHRQLYKTAQRRESRESLYD